MRPEQEQRIRDLAGQDTPIIHAVKIRLEAPEKKDVLRISGQLVETFGRSIALTEPREHDGGRCWVAYGTFM